MVVCVSMNEFELIFGLSALVCGGIMGGLFLRTIPKSSKNIRQQNQDLENLNTYNKKELRSLRGKINSDHALPKVTGAPDDIEGVIGALLPKITDRFPELKGLINSDDIGGIIKLAKEHPDIVKKFLPKFISSGKKDDKFQADNSTV